MPAESRDRLLELYARELAYLREQGRVFAHDNPQIAPRLSFTGADPHVERLIESFAFLTARLSRDLEDELPIITGSLLGALYPQLASPIPAMAIAAFTPQGAGLKAGVEVPKGTALFAEEPGKRDAKTCRFRTAYATTVWPLAVEDVRFEGADTVKLADPAARRGAVRALRIDLESLGPKVQDLGVRRLRFFLAGTRLNASRLYDLLFARDARAFVGGGDGVFSCAARIEPVGFARDEDVLPYPSNAHPGHRLVQEYFAFPEKLFFFDVVFDRIGASRLTGNALQIAVLLEDPPPADLVVGRESLRLGCTPVANLFHKSTEPIRLDHTAHEYRLIADVRREDTTEIHSILRVLSTRPGATEPKVYEPFFSYVHRGEGDDTPRAFWHARRVPSARRDVRGTDMYLSIVDLAFKPVAQADEVVYAEALCSNRDLADELNEGAPLQPERGGLAAKCELLTRPTRQIAAPTGGAALWRLVSNLSLGHVSLADAKRTDDAGAPRGEALREILTAYLFADDAAAEKQIFAVEDLTRRTVTKRVRRAETPRAEAWRGFCTGTELTLTLDESKLTGASAILFGAVLSRFFALYAHLDTFTELVLKKASDPAQEWKRWPLMAGERTLL